VPKKRDQGIGLNHTVNNEIVAVFIRGDSEDLDEAEAGVALAAWANLPIAVH